MNIATVHRQIALGDLLLFSVLAIPGLGSLVLQWIVSLNDVLALPGGLEWSPVVALFLHLVGLLGAAFAFMRLKTAVDGVAIGVTAVVKVVAAMLFGWAVWSGAPALLGAFGIVDLAQVSLLLIASAGGMSASPHKRCRKDTIQS